jgi:hypothetical protein
MKFSLAILFSLTLTVPLASISPMPVPTQYIFPVDAHLDCQAPVVTRTLSWDAPADTNVYCYAVEESPDVGNGLHYWPIARFTNTTHGTVSVSNWWGFLRVVSVNQYGVDSDGAYQW